MIQIEKKEVTEYATYFELSTEKKAAFVGIDKSGTVQVICKNAAHAAYRGQGKFFDSIGEAVAAYKSSAMQEMIRTAAQETLHCVEA